MKFVTLFIIFFFWKNGKKMVENVREISENVSKMLEKILAKC